MESVLVDSGVWYAMFSKRDQYYAEGAKKAELIEMFRVVIPWPTMYETLRTRFVRDTLALDQFERYLKSHDIVYFDDEEYRLQAFELSFDSSLRDKRPISMVDWIIRLMLLDDKNPHFSFLATFNVNDFRDVCEQRGVEII